MSSHQEPSGYNSNEQPQQDLPPLMNQTDASSGYQQGNINAQQQLAPQYPQNMNFENQEQYQQCMQAQPQQQYYSNQQPDFVSQAPYYPIHQWNQPIQQQNYPSQQQNQPSEQPYNFPPQDVQPFAQQQYYQGPSQHQESYQPQEQTWYQPQHPQHYQTNNPVQVPIVETVTISTQTDITLSSFVDDQTEAVQEDDSVQAPNTYAVTVSTQTNISLPSTTGDSIAEVVPEDVPVQVPIANAVTVSTQTNITLLSTTGDSPTRVDQEEVPVQIPVVEAVTVSTETNIALPSTRGDSQTAAIQQKAPVQIPLMEAVTVSTQTNITLSSTTGDSTTGVVQEDVPVQVPIANAVAVSTQTNITLPSTPGDIQTEAIQQKAPVQIPLIEAVTVSTQTNITLPHRSNSSVQESSNTELPSDSALGASSVSSSEQKNGQGVVVLTEKKKQQKVFTAGCANWREPKVSSADTFETPNWRSGNRSQQPPRGTQNREGTEFSSKKSVTGDQSVRCTMKPKTASESTEKQQVSTEKPHPTSEKAQKEGESQELPFEKPILKDEVSSTVDKSQELLTEKPTPEAEEAQTVGESQEMPTEKPTLEVEETPTVGESQKMLTEKTIPEAGEAQIVSKENSIEWFGCYSPAITSDYSFEFDASIEQPEVVPVTYCDLDQSLDFVFEYTLPSVQTNHPEKTESEVPEDLPMSAELASNECEEKVSHHSTGEPNKESQDVIPLTNDSPVVETLTQTASPQPLTRSFADAAGSTQRFHSKETVSSPRQEVNKKVPSSLKEKPKQLKKQVQLKTTAKAPIPTEKVQSQSVAVLSEKKDTVERLTTQGQLNVDSEGWTIVGNVPSSSTELPGQPEQSKEPVKTIKPSTRQVDVKKEVVQVENEKTEVFPSEASPIKKKTNKKKQRKAEKEARNRALAAENDLALSQAHAETATHRTVKDYVRKTLRDFIGRQESVRVTLESSSPSSRTLVVPWFERDSILYAKRHEKPKNAADNVKAFLNARLIFWKENNSVVQRVKDLQVMRYELLSECQSDVIEDDVIYLKELFNAFPSYSQFFESEFLQMIFVTERVSKTTIPSIPIGRSIENDQVMSQEESDCLSQYLERHAQRRYATGTSDWKPEKLELAIIIEFKCNPWEGFSMIDASAYFRARSAAYANVAEPTPEHLQLSRLHNILASVPSPVFAWDAFFMTEAEKVPGEHSAQVYRYHLDVDYFKISFNHE